MLCCLVVMPVSVAILPCTEIITPLTECRYLTTPSHRVRHDRDQTHLLWVVLILDHGASASAVVRVQTGGSMPETIGFGQLYLGIQNKVVWSALL